jgi:hypothetical protein
VSVLGDSKGTIQKHTITLIGAGEEVGLAVYTGNTEVDISLTEGRARS